MDFKRCWGQGVCVCVCVCLCLSATYDFLVNMCQRLCTLASQSVAHLVSWSTCPCVYVCVFPSEYKCMCPCELICLCLYVWRVSVSVHLCVCVCVCVCVCARAYLCNCVCEKAQREACCSYISVQFVPDLKLKFHFQVVNCLPLRPLAHSELKFKLAWPCTAAL